jgi:hypothetical protein
MLPTTGGVTLEEGSVVLSKSSSAPELLGSAGSCRRFFPIPTYFSSLLHRQGLLH